MDENRKTSEALLRAIKKYKAKCVTKQITFKENEMELLDKANDVIYEKKINFSQYVKNLIREDIEKQARLF